MFGALYFTFNRRNICLAISVTTLQKLFLFSYVDKKKVVLDCFYIHFCAADAAFRAEQLTVAIPRWLH
jgi:hypothetical protein